jgi:hypothetical protein
MAMVLDKGKFLPRWYTPEAQRDLPEGQLATEFRLKPLTGSERLHVMTGLDSRTKRFSGEVISYALSVGVIGWKNVRDAKNAPIQFNEISMTMVDEITQAELFSELMSMTVQTEAQAGESSPQL